jgi:hypothetical protein
MKVICLSILLLLTTSAVAYIIDGIEPGDHHRRTRRGVPGNNRALGEAFYAATMKGGKGMGGMGMKDKKGAKGCQTLKMKSLDSEVVAEANAVGGTLFFPLYDYYTNEPIGTYTSAQTEIFSPFGLFVDCVISASYNFGFDESLEFPFEDQIMIAATCKGPSNAITGGTGQYACASGYDTITDIEEADLFVTVLTVCNTCT